MTPMACVYAWCMVHVHTKPMHVLKMFRSGCAQKQRQSRIISPARARLPSPNLTRLLQGMPAMLDLS
jgi:hypothetical protein